MLHVWLTIVLLCVSALHTKRNWHIDCSQLSQWGWLANSANCTDLPFLLLLYIFFIRQRWIQQLSCSTLLPWEQVHLHTNIVYTEISVCCFSLVSRCEVKAAVEQTQTHLLRTLLALPSRGSWAVQPFWVYCSPPLRCSRICTALIMDVVQRLLTCRSPRSFSFPPYEIYNCLCAIINTLC